MNIIQHNYILCYRIIADDIERYMLQKRIYKMILKHWRDIHQHDNSNSLRRIMSFYLLITSNFSTNLSTLFLYHFRIYFNPWIKQVKIFILSCAWPKGSSNPIILNASMIFMPIFSWKTASHLTVGFLVHLPLCAQPSAECLAQRGHSINVG